MTPLHMFVLALVALAVLVTGFVVGMCITASKETPTPEICTRPAPHICTVNGPCNGFPKEKQ